MVVAVAVVVDEDSDADVLLVEEVVVEVVAVIEHRF